MLGLGGALRGPWSNSSAEVPWDNRGQRSDGSETGPGMGVRGEGSGVGVL